LNITLKKEFNLKIVILTTETPHHNYFVQQILNYHKLAGVVVETSSLKPGFETFHPFEKQRDEYEKEVFFKNKPVQLSDFSETFETESVNEDSACKYLQKIQPDVIITFGTGLIRKNIIEICPNGFVNLHGGDPEEYRGLDTHLWAIYHRDFSGLVVTLHRLNEELDDGDIIHKGLIEVDRNMKIHEIRRYNTEICVELTLNALNTFHRLGRFISTPQRKRGRYYSFIPAVLKEICCDYFNKYTEKL